jgi:hypothetical protein
MLLARGAEIDATDAQGYTALHAAVAQNSIAAARVLVAEGADMSVATRHGYSPLDIARHLNFGELTAFIESGGVSGDSSTAARSDPSGLAALRRWLALIGCAEYAARFEAAGFDGVKIDNCGDDRGLGYIARLAAINASGHALLVENSNQGKMGNPRGNPTNDSYCPYNFFRSGGDIGPDFNNVISKLQRTLPYLGNETTPVISRPGCWAYPVSCRLRHCCRCRGALGSRVPLLPRASLRAQAHLQPLLLPLLRNRVGHA